MDDHINKLFQKIRREKKETGQVINQSLYFYNKKAKSILSWNFETDEEKMKKLFTIGFYCKNHNIKEIYLTFDSYVRILQSEDPKLINYINDNWDTEKPELYPENMRQEHLIILKMKFPNKMNLYAQEYSYINDNINFKSVQESDMFDGLIFDCLRDGYNFDISKIL